MDHASSWDDNGGTCRGGGWGRQTLRRGVMAKKVYTDMWMKIAIKEGVGYLLGLRKAKFDIYYGFKRRESSVLLQKFVRRWNAARTAKLVRALLPPQTHRRGRVGSFQHVWLPMLEALPQQRKQGRNSHNPLALLLVMRRGSSLASSRDREP